MQASIDAILSVANASGLFQRAQDGVFDDNEDYPAFVIIEDETPLQALTTDSKQYTAPVEIETAILIKQKGNDRSDVRQMGKDFTDLLTTDDPAFRATNMRTIDAQVGRRDVYVCYLDYIHDSNWDVTT